MVSHVDQKSISEFLKVDNYIKKVASKMKPYRGKFKELKQNTITALSKVDDQLVQIGDEEFLRLEERNRKIPLNKALITEKVQNFFPSESEAQRFLDYLFTPEYESQVYLKRKKGLYEPSETGDLAFDVVSDDDEDEDDRDE